MPDIFKYTDYRKYLHDYYTIRKKENPVFSYGVLSEMAGFRNRGFVFNVIAGKKNLSKSSVVKIARALKMIPKESDYFENLVSFNQAKSHQDRAYFFDKLSGVTCNRGGVGRIREIRKDQYEFYSKWYYSVIRSIIDMHEFKGDYPWLAARVFPRIRPKEAKKAVMLLSRLKMVRKGKNGAYKICDKAIVAGREIVQTGLLNFQVQTAELAIKAAKELPRDKRHISGLTMGISRETYDKICGELETFKSRIIEMAEKDPKADRVYQMNFHIIPLSSPNGSKKGGES